MSAWWLNAAGHRAGRGVIMRYPNDQSIMLTRAGHSSEAFMPSHRSELRKTLQLPWDSLEKSARTYFRASPLERVQIIKARVPAKYVVTLTSSMKMTKEALYGSLNLARATIDRKVLKRELLNQDESERVLTITDWWVKWTISFASPETLRIQCGRMGGLLAATPAPGAGWKKSWRIDGHS